jgi:hypothetical protein
MAIGYIGTAQNSADGSAGTIATGARTVTAGNLLVAVIGNETSGPVWVTGIQDDADVPNVFTYVARINGSADSCEIWYAKNITGKVNSVVTATFASNASYRKICVLEFSGCDLTTPWVSDEYALGSGSGTAFATGDMPSTDVAESVLVSGVMLYATSTINSWDDNQTHNFSVVDTLSYFGAAYYIESASAIYRSKGVAGSSGNWANVVAAFGAGGAVDLTTSLADKTNISDQQTTQLDKLCVIKGGYAI